MIGAPALLMFQGAFGRSLGIISPACWKSTLWASCCVSPVETNVTAVTEELCFS